MIHHDVFRVVFVLVKLGLCYDSIPTHCVALQSNNVSSIRKNLGFLLKGDNSGAAEELFDGSFVKKETMHFNGIAL